MTRSSPSQQMTSLLRLSPSSRWDKLLAAMPNINTKAHVLVRDHFRCRYCGAKLFLPQAVKVLDWHVPGLNLWDRHGRREPLRTCWATVDHIIPEIGGGMDTLENLIACCVTCNSRKGGAQAGSCTELQHDEEWDGLSGVFLALAAEYRERLSSEDIKWLNALEREGSRGSVEAVDDAVRLLRDLKEQRPVA